MTTAHYRNTWQVNPQTFSWGTAQRVAQVSSGFQRWAPNLEVPNAVRDDIRSLAGRKVKSMTFSVFTRSQAGGTINGSVVIESQRAALVVNATGEPIVISGTGLDYNGGLLPITADARLYYSYVAWIVPNSVTTVVLNDTLNFQECIFLDLEYYVD